MALPRQPEIEQPLTEGSLAVDPNKVVTTPARIVPFPTIDGAVPPTQEEIEAANAGVLVPGKTGSFIEKLAHNWAVRLGLVTGTSVASYQVPAIHERIDAAYLDILDRLGLAIVVPPTFDNKLDKGAIGENNTVTLPLSEIQPRFPDQVVEQDHALTMLFPFQLPEGTKAKFEKSLAEFLGTHAIRDEAQKNNVKDHVDIPLPKGTTVIAPVSGNALIMEALDNKQMSSIARFFYYDQTTNTTYALLIFTHDASGGHTYFQPLTESQPNTKWDGEKWKNLPRVAQGTPVLKTIRDNQVITLSVTAYNGQNIVLATTDAPKGSSYVVTPQFLTQEENGQQKIVVLEQ